MFRRILLATAVLCTFTVTAQARQHSPHHHHRLVYHHPHHHFANRHASRDARRHAHHYARRTYRHYGRSHHGGYARAWCGIYMARYFGKPDRRLALALEWAHVGANAGGPGIGVIVVWRHHVGVITGQAPNGQWIVHSGNDGGAVRTRPRSIAGAIAFRRV